MLSGQVCPENSGEVPMKSADFSVILSQKSREIDIFSATYQKPCFIDLDFVPVNKNAKKEFGQYATILTSNLVNNAYLLVIVTMLWINSYSGLWIKLFHH